MAEIARVPHPGRLLARVGIFVEAARPGACRRWIVNRGLWIVDDGWLHNRSSAALAAPPLLHSYSLVILSGAPAWFSDPRLLRVAGAESKDLLVVGSGGNPRVSEYRDPGQPSRPVKMKVICQFT